MSFKQCTKASVQYPNSTQIYIVGNSTLNYLSVKEISYDLENNSLRIIEMDDIVFYLSGYPFKIYE